MDQPVPFEIVRGDDATVASNGRMRLTVLGAAGVVRRRRAISGLGLRPAGEVLLPQLNALAGELLQRPDMPADEAVGRLLALAGLVPTAKPVRHEWVYACLDGVFIYTDGAEVIVTNKELEL